MCNWFFVTEKNTEVLFSLHLSFFFQKTASSVSLVTLRKKVFVYMEIVQSYRIRAQEELEFTIWKEKYVHICIYSSFKTVLCAIKGCFRNGTLGTPPTDFNLMILRRIDLKSFSDTTPRPETYKTGSCRPGRTSQSIRFHFTFPIAFLRNNLHNYKCSSDSSK